MKRPLFFLSLVAALALAPSLRAEVSPVTVRAEQVSKDDNNKTGKVQNKSLKILVTNNSAQAMDGLKVKYYFFGKDVKDHDVMILEQGEKGANVKAHGSEMVESPVITEKSTDAHSTGGKNGRGGKKVEASGKKVTGYGAQVFDKGKVVADYFSAPSLKAMVGGSKE